MSESPSILVGISGERAWVRVQAKGTFLNSPGLKKFANEMIERGKKDFVIDLKACPGMDSTFMGTLAGIALRLNRTNGGTVHIVHITDRNRDALKNLGLDQLIRIHGEDESKEAGQAQVTPLVAPDVDQADQARTMLEAHEALVEAEPENLDQFKDVLDFLRDDVEGQSD